MVALAQRKVLAVNKSRHPVAVWSVEKAIKAVCSTYKDGTPKAHILHTLPDDPYQNFEEFTWQDWSELVVQDGEASIKSAKRHFKIPEIIILSRYNKLPQQRVHFSRRTIYRRDGNQCQYCNCKPGTTELTLDHIVPRCQGGQTTWTNCILACVECNRLKADLAPAKFYSPVVDKNGKEKMVPHYKVQFRKLDKAGRTIGYTTRTIREPVKPKFTFYKGECKCDSWVALMGEAYWQIELDNDN